MTGTEPQWLAWVREIQATAQTGLTFTRDPYDRERYEALRHLAARIMATGSDTPVDAIAALFDGETGYATPKLDVRGAVFDADGRLLLVRETADHGRWTLPGGWADVNLTPAENVVKEVYEESGYRVRTRKLVALWDRTRQGHGPAVFSCAKAFFLCDLLGGAATPSIETSEIGWFGENALPDDLSTGRVLPAQLRLMFAHHRDPALPTAFD